MIACSCALSSVCFLHFTGVDLPKQTSHAEYCLALLRRADGRGPQGAVQGQGGLWGANGGVDGASLHDRGVVGGGKGGDRSATTKGLCVASTCCTEISH